MKFKTQPVLLGLLALLLLATANAQRGETSRTIRGQVVGPDKKPVAEALVHLKNLKTGEVLTVVTGKEGRYLFAGVPQGIDFELYAEFQELRSARRKLSRFDRRTNIFHHFDLKKPKKNPEKAKKKPKSTP